MENIVERISKEFNKGRVGDGLCLFNSNSEYFTYKEREKLAQIFYDVANRLFYADDLYNANSNVVIDLLKQAHKLNDTDQQIIDLLSSAYFQKAQRIKEKDLNDALRYLRKAIKLNNNEDAKTLIENITDASVPIRTRLKSIVKEKNTVESRVNLCNYDIDTGALEEAMCMFEKIEYDPTNPEVVLLYSRVDYIRNRLDQALERLLTIKDYDSRVTILLNKIYKRLDNNDEALRILIDANKEDPDNIYIIKELIDFYISNENYNIALETLKQYKEELNENEYNQIMYYLNNKLGLSNIKPETYMEQQVVCYSSNATIIELARIHSKYNKSNAADKKKKHNISAKPMILCSLKDLVEVATERITNLIPSETGMLDRYVVAIKDLQPFSKINTRNTYTYEIHTLSNTKDIVMIAPISIVNNESLVKTKNKQFDL